MAIDLDKLLKLPLPKRIAILLVLLSIIAALFYNLSYSHKKEMLARLKPQLLEAKRKLLESKDAADRLPEFKKAVEELNRNFKEVLAQLPDKKEIPTLLTNISNAGKEAGLEFILFKPLSEARKEFYAEVPVSIKIKGGYHNLASFFLKVGEMPRIVNITDLNIGGAKDKDGIVILNSDFRATTFMFLGKEKGE
ncbi:MAG: type 4a pilus biogenesis protein PilO [Thermodesulfobacteriota bacterium]